MKKMILLTLALVCLLVFIPDCSPTDTRTNNIFYAWNQEVGIGVGDTFSVTLESNPTTGFQWELREFSQEGIVELISSEYQLGEEAKQKHPYQALVG
jgi:hypothetical protein